MYMSKVLDANEIEIIKTIIDNENINHNELRRIIVEKRKLMAIRTFDKTMKYLREDGRVTITKDKNRLYSIPRFGFFTSPDSDEFAKTSLDTLEEMIRTRWQVAFQKSKGKDKIKTTKEMYNILQNGRKFFETLWLSRYGTAVKTQTQREIKWKFDQLFILLFEIISSDSEGDRIKFALSIDALYSGGDSKEVNTLMAEYVKIILDVAVEYDASKTLSLKEEYENSMVNITEYQKRDSLSGEEETLEK